MWGLAILGLELDLGLYARIRTKRREKITPTDLGKVVQFYRAIPCEPQPQRLNTLTSWS